MKINHVTKWIIFFFLCLQFYEALQLLHVFFMASGCEVSRFRLFVCVLMASKCEVSSVEVPSVCLCAVHLTDSLFVFLVCISSICRSQTSILISPHTHETEIHQRETTATTTTTTLTTSITATTITQYYQYYSTFFTTVTLVRSALVQN